MDCNEFFENIDRYFDESDLDENIKSAMEGHFLSCKYCQNRYGVHALLKDKKFTDSIKDDIHEEMQRRSKEIDIWEAFQNDIKWVAFGSTVTLDIQGDINLYGYIKSRKSAYEAVEKVWKNEPNQIFHMRVLHRLHYFDKRVDEFREKAKRIIDSMTQEQKNKLVQDLEGWIYDLADRELEIYSDGFLDCMSGLLLDYSQITAAKGYWCAVLGDMEEALEYFNINPKMAPSEPERNISIAIAYYDLNQKDMFWKYLETAELSLKDDSGYFELVKDIKGFAKREEIKANIKAIFKKLYRGYNRLDPSRFLPSEIIEMRNALPSSV